MSHYPKPHNTFFSLRMVVSNTKATTEIRLAVCRQRRGKFLSTLHMGGSTNRAKEENGTHVLAADQHKADPTIMKLQQLQQPKTTVLKNYRMWVLSFPSLCFVHFAGLCLPTFLTIFPEELELKKRLIQGTLDYCGSLVITVSILAVKYER